jgi:hypothetical protein
VDRHPDARLKEATMKNSISLNGHILVSDILTAFEPMVSEGVLAVLDKELQSRNDERLMFDDTEVLVEEAVDALDDADALPEPEDIDLDQTDVKGLAEAIRCGDTVRLASRQATRSRELQSKSME